MKDAATEEVLALGRVVRPAFFAVDQQIINLVIPSVQQDRLASATGEIDRMIARYEYRRRFHNVADSWWRNHFEADFAIRHLALPTGESAHHVSQSPAPVEAVG